jgi:hypothetical protein
MVHNYDEREYTSNGLARWFLNIGTRSQLSHYIHDQWLGRPTSEKIGGNYGHPTPDVNLDFVDTYGSVAMMGSDESGWVNRLSTLTIAEFLKRLVMHREDPDLALPHLKWSDVSTLMYGAEDSVYYDAATPQGMQGDTAVYLQSGLNMDELEKNSKGQWRIFGKLGFGYERGGEFVHASYGCFPKLDDQGQAIPDVGKEMIIVTQLNGQGDHHKTDARLASIYSTLVQGVMNGTIK